MWPLCMCNVQYAGWCAMLHHNMPKQCGYAHHASSTLANVWALHQVHVHLPVQTKTQSWFYDTNLHDTVLKSKYSIVSIDVPCIEILFQACIKGLTMDINIMYCIDSSWSIDLRAYPYNLQQILWLKYFPTAQMTLVLSHLVLNDREYKNIHWEKETLVYTYRSM